MTTGSLQKTVAVGGVDHVEDVLVSNSTQNSSPTPVVVKTGNFKIQGDCLVSSQNNITSPVQVIVYIMYLPEVVVAQANAVTAIQDHPEWIMAWKVVDVTNGVQTSNSSSFSFSSRLKRNLNSGDCVALVTVVKNPSTVGSAISCTINYAAQYWTCSN